MEVEEPASNEVVMKDVENFLGHNENIKGTKKRNREEIKKLKEQYERIKKSLTNKIN